MNGPTLPEDFWGRLDERFNHVHEKLDGISSKVHDINANGCAQRVNDVKRLDSLETWRDRTIIGTISLAGSIVYTWLTRK
jgi:hypothetical protein